MKQVQHDLLDPSSLNWHHYNEDADYPYPVSYWGTILDMDDAGHISVVYRWDPGSFATSTGIYAQQLLSFCRVSCM